MSFSIFFYFFSSLLYKNGKKGLKTLVLVGLLLVVLFFLVAYTVKEGFTVKSTHTGCNGGVCLWYIISTAPTKERALSDLRGFCTDAWTGASVSNISTPTPNANGTYSVTGTCSRNI